MVSITSTNLNQISRALVCIGGHTTGLSACQRVVTLAKEGLNAYSAIRFDSIPYIQEFRGKFALSKAKFNGIRGHFLTKIFESCLTLGTDKGLLSHLHDKMVVKSYSVNLYGRAIPKEMLFRLWIDVNDQTRGESAYENEKGYKDGMKAAFKYMEETLGTRMNASEFEKIHDLCVDGVLSKDGVTPFIKGYLIDPLHHNYYRMICSSITPEAKKEWEEKKRITSDKSKLGEYLAACEESDLEGYINILSKMTLLIDDTIDKVHETINQLFERYYDSVRTIVPGCETTRREQLAAIVNLCTDLAIYHPFCDGNQRTVAFVLLNKLLRENGLAAGVILNWPFVFDGYRSTSQLVDEVELGIKNFNTHFPRLSCSSS